MGDCLMDGNEAMAWGAVVSGCRFFAGYPITPATTIFNTMLKLLPPLGGTCLQGEDEIASIGYCLGASMGGLKAMTASSGPGISLYSEHISFAIGSEIPIVIVDVQRLGPSTGSATRGADGDIQFLRWGNSGGLPVIVLAPVDVTDCYLLTINAFNLAEVFRCPVFIASNKEIAMTRENMNMDGVDVPKIKERLSPPNGKPFIPFQVSSESKIPYFLPIGGDVIVRQTSSTHGVDGYITTDSDEITRIQDRLNTKLTSEVKRFSFHESFIEEDADTLLVTYGITARAARDAYRVCKNSGRPVSLLILKTLWPVPEELIKETAEHVQRVVVVEMNLGQYVREIERILPDKTIDFLGQMDGRLISPTQIAKALAHG
jgi:2-oxoglutarate/2-oxoacid ferredoxin oxidoreductase subunit alpha